MLVGYNYSPEPTGIGKYSGEMTEWLASRGYQCTVITTYPYYPYWKVQEPYHKRRFLYTSEKTKFESGGSINVIRCPIYVPGSPSGLKRIILDFTFLITSGLALVLQLFKKRQDVFMSIAPSFLIGLPGVIYKKLRGTHLIYHIQDMQIEAAHDLGMIRSKSLVRILYGLERFIFRNADVVSTISDGMRERIKRKAGKEIYFFPNWTDVSMFFPVENKAQLKESFGFKPSDKIALYSGGIGQKQGLEAIVHAAEWYRDQLDLQFIICGSGPYKRNLEAMVAERNLKNVTFFPLQPLEKFNAFLNLADVHLVIQKADASDLMMPSKLTAILAVGGLALITANPGSGLYQLVDAHGVGIVVKAEDQPALNSGIAMLLESENHLTRIRVKARSYAEAYLDMENIMGRFRKDQL